MKLLVNALLKMWWLLKEPFFEELSTDKQFTRHRSRGFTLRLELIVFFIVVDFLRLFSVHNNSIILHNNFQHDCFLRGKVSWMNAQVTFCEETLVSAYSRYFSDFFPKAFADYHVSRV